MQIDQRHAFYLAQAVFGGVFILFLLRARNQSSTSQFRSTEGKPTPANASKKSSQPDALAHAKLKPKSAPLALPGIVTQGAAHEILGIKPNASEDEIRRAYRDLMKRYHPDKLKQAQQSSQNSAEWKDAQKVAEAINRAKDEMLKQKR